MDGDDEAEEVEGLGRRNARTSASDFFGDNDLLRNLEAAADARGTTIISRGGRRMVSVVGPDE